MKTSDESPAAAIRRIMDEMGAETEVIGNIILDLKTDEGFALMAATHDVVCRYIASCITPRGFKDRIEEQRISIAANNLAMGLTDDPDPFKDWPGDKR